MITCVVHYTIDPAQIEAFERFTRAWMRLVTKHGGIHHGYFLRPKGRAIEPRRYSASRAWLRANAIVPGSATIRSSSPQTGSGTSRAAFSVTNGR